MATDYELVNAASQLEAGAKYVIGSADVTSAVFMGTKDNKNNRVQTPEVAITDGKITLTDTILVLELGGEADAWTFQTQNYHGTNGYLSNASSGTTNACFVQEAAMSFTIAFDGNKAVITSNGGNARNIMRYNSGSKCFACYASGQKDIYLYKEVASQGGEEPVVEPTTKTIYLNGGGASLWNQADPEFFVHSWGGAADGDVHMTLVEGDVYKADIPADNTDLLFLRLATGTTEIVWSGDAHWNQSANQTIPEGKDLFTMTSWDNGEWSVYGEEPVVEPTLANGYYLVGSMTEWAVVADEAHTFAVNPENDAEYMLNFTLAENDAFKVVKVEGESQTWYPEGMDNNYTVDAAHAGEKTIYFRPDGQGGEGWHSGVIYIAANEEPQPAEVDFTKPFTLLFNGTNGTGDNSSTFKVSDGVAAIFDAASAPYVSELTSVENVFAGRIIAEEPSSLKFGTSSKKGTLAFTLGQEIEVDSIIVNATQYGKGAAEVTVNGVKFDLTAGNKVPTDCKITPEGKVSAITIAQTGSERIYLRYVKVYPKQAGEEPVVEPAKFYITGDSALVVNAGLDKAKAWNPDAIKSTETSYKLNLAAGDYKLKVTVDGTWETAKGFNDLTTTADGLTADGDGNICFTLTEAGEVNVHYESDAFFLIGNFYVAPVVVKYYLKNNWGSEAWSWKEMTDLGDGTYMLYNVVVGGEGVNRNTAESDEGASWFTWADIETFDASYEPATIGALDTVVIYFDPEAVNSFTGANGMSAQILGKYVAPVEPQGCDWENIEFLGDGSPEQTFGNQFKVCKEGDVPGVVNIQKPGFAAETGIYVTFPSPVFGEISLAEGQYVINGAGMVLYLSAFTAQETEVSVVCDGNTYVFTVYNALGGAPEVNYYMKNNWDAADWTWKAMTKDGETYKLENVVFGGTGVNYNTAESDDGSSWVPVANIAGDAISAKDTVTLVLDPAAGTVTATLIGKYNDPNPGEHTYTVAGNLTAAFGTAWNPADAHNDMVLNGVGIYLWEKTELTLPEGTIEFKVCEDHAWDVAYPASNYQLAIPEAGIYTIYISFNPETKEVNANATKTGDATVTVDYYLVGSVKGWEAKAENIFTLNAEAGEGIEEYVIETTLEVGEGLKVLSSTGTWYPEGMGNEYVVDQNHAGATTIYFRPAGNAEWEAFGGYMYVVPTGTTGIDAIDANAPAVKVLRNGQIFIIKGDKTYNVMGAIVR